MPLPKPIAECLDWMTDEQVEELALAIAYRGNVAEKVAHHFIGHATNDQMRRLLEWAASCIFIDAPAAVGFLRGGPDNEIKAIRFSLNAIRGPEDAT